MHIPVLLNEVLEYLDPKPGEDFIDCTVGEAGHALAILKMTAPNGVLLGIDRDEGMVIRLRERADIMDISDRFIIKHGNFASLREITRRATKEHGFGPIKGILFDFGMSSWQLDESGAGFSFKNIEPLDMRFDRTSESETAASIVNSWPEDAIYRILSELGEERYARRIAKEIVIVRKKTRILTTDQLAGIISRVTPHRKGGIHSATRTFQALRIAVNGELENVKKGLDEAINILSPGGRIGAISFHSLEDRIVKNVFKEGSSRGLLRIITKKPISSTPEEIGENPRARSAKLRIAERI